MKTTHQQLPKQISERELLVRRIAMICTIAALGAVILVAIKEVLGFSVETYTTFAVGLVAVIGAILPPLVFLNSPLSAEEHERALESRRARKSADLGRSRVMRARLAHYRSVPIIAYATALFLAGVSVAGLAWRGNHLVVGTDAKHPMASEMPHESNTADTSENPHPVERVHAYLVRIPEGRSIPGYFAPTTTAQIVAIYTHKGPVLRVVCLVSIGNETWASLENHTFVPWRYLMLIRRPHQPPPSRC